MKIAIFSDSFFPMTDGVTISIKNNAELFSKQNKLFFFVPSKLKKLNIKNAKYIKLKTKDLKEYKGYQIRIPKFKKVYKELKKIKPDIVHIHSPSGIGLEGLVNARLLKIPVIATSHTLFPEVTEEINLKGFERTKIFKKMIWNYLVMFLNRCTGVITPSEAMKTELLNHKVTKPIYVISNGIDTKKFSYILRKNKEPVFISTGRLVESKHVDNTLKAFYYFKKNGGKGKLTIVGDGPNDKKLKDFVKRKKISKDVKFLGFIKYDKIINAYKKSDVFVTSSTIETEGISTLEAMSTGLPVIGVNARATPYLVKENTGFIVPVNKPKKMAEKMLELSKNYSLRQEFGKNATKEVKKYDLRKANKKLYKTYEKIIADYKLQKLKQKEKKRIKKLYNIFKKILSKYKRTKQKKNKKT